MCILMMVKALSIGQHLAEVFVMGDPWISLVLTMLFSILSHGQRLKNLDDLEIHPHV